MMQNLERFHDSIKQNGFHTLFSIYKLTKRLCRHQRIKARHEHFERRLISKEARRDKSLKKNACHQFSNTPLLIADAGRKLLPCVSKSDLAAILEAGGSSE